MPKVPSRQLSHGELIHKLNLAYKKNQERKARYLRLKRRKQRKTEPTRYTEEDVIKRIDELNDQYKGY